MILFVREKDGSLATVNCEKVFSAKFTQEDGMDVIIFKSENGERVTVVEIIDELTTLSAAKPMSAMGAKPMMAAKPTKKAKGKK